MKAATRPHEELGSLKLLLVDQHGIAHLHLADFPSLLEPGDLVVANDAATLPASLTGLLAATGAHIEVRLAGSPSLRPEDSLRFTAVVFGAGDHHTPTEQRPLPPPLFAGDQLLLGPLRARVRRVLGHPRLVELQFEGRAAEVWEGIARHGRPIQYAYVPEPLATWDTWTRIAGPPVAFEAPSAGFALDWSMLKLIRGRGVHFATLTHAAGISSTGDLELDARLPLDEPYEVPGSTSALIAATRAAGGRVIAVGTTVVRALEDAVRLDGTVRSGAGLATRRIGPQSDLRVVDAIVSGMHEPGTSHYELLKAFVDDDVLRRATEEAEARGYQAHEYGDVMMVRRLRGDPVRPRSPRLLRRRLLRYPIRTLRTNCELSSRKVFLRDSSAVVGCTTPFASVARETIVWSPGVAPSHL